MSGGQQQRLCIARALAVQPEVLLMDEPTSALDPISTTKIEDLVLELKKQYTIVMVTHNMQQAARISDQTAFFPVGRDDRDGRYRKNVFYARGLQNGRLHYGEVWIMGRKVYQEQLRKLNSELIQMGDLCEKAMSLVMKALREKDEEIARGVTKLSGD